MMDENAQGIEGDDDYIFNEYAIDDTLDPLTRLVKYHTSDFSLQRLVLIRELTDTAIYAGYDETINQLLPLLNNFVSDSEPAVRQMFVQQLYPLAEFIVKNGGEAGYQELLTVFLPFTFELLVDKNVEVGNSAIQALNKLADLVKEPQVQMHLLTVIVTLSHDERAEDYRVVAAQLFNDLAPKFGPKLCQETVINEVSLLSSDMSFSVRKTVAANLGSLGAVVPPQVAVDRVLPIFLTLCKDEIWGVRKACAESIVSVSKCVTREARLQHVIPAFKLLSEDSSRWVRVAAYQNLGQLLHTMTSEDISPMFLKIYTDMAFQSEGGDSDFAEYCAFSFPAVLSVIGRNRWKEVDDTFSTLLKDVQWKVRRSLAHSLHDIARIVGQEIAERCLIPAFDIFLRDLDEVKIGVIQNLAPFMECVTQTVREQYLPIICSVPLESENWRIRNVVAAKVGGLASLVSPQAVNEHLVELTLKLLDDSVSEVRCSTYHSCGLILSYLQGAAGGQQYYQRFLRIISDQANKEVYHKRQLFTYIFQQLVELTRQVQHETNACQVAEQLFDRYLALAKDPISNVRFVVARVLAVSLLNSPMFHSHQFTVQAHKLLSDDPDRDVAAMATAKQPSLEDPTLATSYYH